MWPVLAEIIGAATGYEQSNCTHLTHTERWTRWEPGSRSERSDGGVG